MSKNTPKKRGGNRPGAGRPHSGRIPVHFRLLPKTIIAIREEAEVTKTSLSEVVDTIVREAAERIADEESAGIKYTAEKPTQNT